MDTTTKSARDRGRKNRGVTVWERARRLHRQQRLVLDSLLLGVVGAFSARLFMLMLGGAQALFLTHLAGYTPPGLPSEGHLALEHIGAHGLWLLPLATTLGGLISGILVYSFAPEAEGHGTDAAVSAFHQAGGYLCERVPLVKAVATAVTLGSGGAAGREGPTALISAGVGAVYATLWKRSERERRLLMVTGMAAGLAAIFRSPIGTAIFAVEVLYGGMEFEAAALLYTMLASVVAYAVNGLFVGWSPLFQVPAGIGAPLADYPWYVVLGVAAGIIGTLLPLVFYGMRDGFRALSMPAFLKPALGGLGVGLLALQLRQVLGGGYGWVQMAIDGRLPALLMVTLVFGQILALSLTISSGGSGGVFAPSLFIGTMLGGSIAQTFNLPVAPFAVVGMAAVFGGAARVPLATLLMVTEMTGGYALLVPTALAVTLSFLVQSVLSAPFKYKSLYEAQVSDQSESPAHALDYLGTALQLLSARRIKVPTTVGPLDLRAALTAGIAVEIADDKRLLVAPVEQESPLVGQPLDATFPVNAQGEAEVVLVFRDQRALWPNPDMVLESGDQLLVITASSVRKDLQAVPGD